MRIIVWSPSKETNWIPPFGAEVETHLLGFVNFERRNMSCSAWQLLYYILKAQNLRIEEVVFEENGKPYFRNNETYFSISHSRDICAVSIADVPTGVDVEQVKKNYHRSLIMRTLSINEKNIFDGDFTKIWCYKECIAKLTGHGLGSRPAKINTLDPKYSFRSTLVSYNSVKYRLAAAFLGIEEDVAIIPLNIKDIDQYCKYSL